MAMVINTNISSLNAQRQLSGSASKLATSMERLSSGLRINSAKDDAAGLAISSRMTTQITGLNVAQRNANDGISLAQTAEGALSTIENNLQRIRELAVQSANATNSSSDRAALQKEVNQLTEEIDRVAKTTEFNGTKLLNGDFSSKAFQVGANKGQTIIVDKIADAKTSALGLYQGVELSEESIGTASDTAAAAKVTVGGKEYNLGTIANDAKAIASALNKAGIDGLSAEANSAKVEGAATQTAGTEDNFGTLEINGVEIELTVKAQKADSLSAAAEAINAKSSTTGVKAEIDGEKLNLVSTDGRNITHKFTPDTTDAAAASDFGLSSAATAATEGGTLSMTYSAPDGVTGKVTFDGVMGGLEESIGSTGTALSELDISDVPGAERAMMSVDAALKAVSSARADLGAIQNRFESVVSNLAVNAENLTASRSRILDADFAVETANLSSAQVLQQAGTAMVAQANQLPQNVLSLLR